MASQLGTTRHQGATRRPLMAGRLLAVFIYFFAMGHAEGFVSGGQGLVGAHLRSLRSTRTRQNIAPVMIGKRPAPGKASIMPFSRKNTDVAKNMSETLSCEITMDSERKAEVEACLERYNAVYTMLWKRCSETGSYRVVGHYSTDSRKSALRRVRGDDKTFASESAKLSIPGTGNNLIATAERTGEEVIISNPGRFWSLKRRKLALEFGIKHIHFVPVPGGGVMEYGRLAGEELEIVRLLNLQLPQILRPKSFKGFVRAFCETLWLLLLLVKIENGDIFAGLSKAWVELNAAAFGFEKSLEHGADGVGASAATRRARLLVAMVAPAFHATRAVVTLIKASRQFWRRRFGSERFVDPEAKKLKLSELRQAPSDQQAAGAR